jgi:hypothetical protein
MPQWKELAQRISMNLGFRGEVSNVTASSPEKTDEPFRFSYKYVREDFADWPNRRIVTPDPYILLPAATIEMVAALPVPFWIGEPIDVSFHSVMEVPKDYSLEPPASVHLKHDFARFDATYSFKDGKLTSDRILRTFISELPKSSFDNYLGFCKAVENDYGDFIQLTSDNASPASQQATVATSFFNAIRTLPDSSNQEALRLETQADEAFTATIRRLLFPPFIVPLLLILNSLAPGFGSEGFCCPCVRQSRAWMLCKRPLPQTLSCLFPINSMHSLYPQPPNSPNPFPSGRTTSNSLPITRTVPPPSVRRCSN